MQFCDAPHPAGANARPGALTKAADHCPEPRNGPRALPEPSAWRSVGWGDGRRLLWLFILYGDVLLPEEPVIKMGRCQLTKWTIT
jgi:hypothetical protein